jgi:hypothetical protein
MIAVALIATIVAAVIFLRGPPNAVPLPDYLSHCVNATLFYHSHPNLTVNINGANIPLPASSFDPSCPQPLHTHDSSGVIHVETDVDRDYTLGDWFLLWGHYQNDANYAIFNATQVFNHKADATHSLTMTVNGVRNYSFQNYVIPRNAVTGQASCTPVPAGGCQPDNIMITYG